MDNNTTDLKYQILKNDSIQINVWMNNMQIPIKLFRIIALRDIETINGLILNGTVGGYIQSESNLSQSDNSWIHRNGKVYQNARLNNSFVTDESCIFGHAILNDSVVSGRVRIWDTSNIMFSRIQDNVDINTGCQLDNVIAKNWSIITNNAKVYNCIVADGSRISDSTVKNSELYDQAEVKSKSTVNNCKLRGRTVISNKTIENQTLNEQIELNETIFQG